MRLKEFVTTVKNNLDQIKTYSSESQLEDDVFMESEAAAEELQNLLEEYKDSDVVITNEKSLEPFYQFLASRRNKMLQAGTSYKDHPKAKGNMHCEILAKKIIVAANQIEYKPRDKDKLLMAAINLNLFAKEAWTDLSNLSLDSPEDVDPYVYIESALFLNQLRTLIENSKSDNPVSLDDFAPILQLLHERWQHIEGSDADYRVNPGTHANRVCDYLTKYMYNVLKNNHPNMAVPTPEQMLMPSFNPTVDSTKTNDKLRESVFYNLKKEDNLKPEQQVITNILRNSKIDMRVFAIRLLGELKNIKQLHKDNINKLDLIVYLESQRTLAKLQQRLKQSIESNAKISIDSLTPFISFLRDRWDLIDGTKASYDANYNTNANQSCEILADHLSLAGHQIDFRKRDQSRLLKPAPHYDLDEAKANERLCLAVISDLKNSDDLIIELMSLDQSKWKEYVNLFDLESFTKLLANGKTTNNDLLQVKDVFTHDEARSKAILFCYFDIHANDRSKTTSPNKSIAGSFLGMFKQVPTTEQNGKAVEEVQKYLLSDAKLAGFFTVLNDPTSELHKCKNILADGPLKEFVAHLARAVDQLPAEKTQTHDVHTRRQFV